MTRYELPAVVVEHRQRATNQYELILHAPPIAERATPGQFVMLRPMRTHAPLWRRPYSILRANPDKGVFSVFYSVQSAFTELLSLKPIGSTVQTLGPLGSYFVPVRTARRHILAAGGVGAPPLCFFASRLAPTLRAGEQLLILAGARRRDLLVEPIPSAVYACGPNRMLRVVAQICIERGVPCQVSLDAPMPCGTGVCLGCAVKVATPDGGVWYKRACTEGPVFRAEEVVWE